MKRSSLVAAGLAGTVAALLAGCSTEQQTADCVDANGRVLDDSACQNSGPYSGGAHWVYGGSYSSSGSTGYVSGGSVTPDDGADVVSRSGTEVSHGGFGDGGEGHGGDGGGHGGGGGE